MEANNPAVRGGAAEKLGGFRTPITLSAHRAQVIAARFALPIETAAIVAALAFGGPHYG
ncbi:hypothetical protein [Novosphingobium rosa]|uniref:hypothetical protein n=1 Tax=Novosphingobium rosa TaxID=76978 RepID=UPI000A880B53|nr:hypothetical protein [Novosphingobium rosa]